MQPRAILQRHSDNKENTRLMFITSSVRRPSLQIPIRKFLRKIYEFIPSTDTLFPNILLHVVKVLGIYETLFLNP